MPRRPRAGSLPSASRSKKQADEAGPVAQRVLIVSASMGAGHDGAARELARRIERRGHTAEVRDFLDAGPLRIGSALRSGYEFELRHVPSAYNATYRFWHKVPWMAPVIAWLITLLTRRRVLRWTRQFGADVVVSTYPLATLCLGHLRASRRLDRPAVNFITDFGVHPLWVHRGIDLNLAVHAGPAELAYRRTKRPGIACGPMVADRFDPAAASPERRRKAREDLGIADDDIAVLIVAGSWGVGGLRETFESVTSIPSAVPVVVCGKDETLLARVSEAAATTGTRAVVIGWTDEMPALMAASDVLVENAGGLTAFEAMRIGLPVVSYRPIAGHGIENTAAMAAAGVSITAADADELAVALDRVGRPGPARAEQVATARSMFVSDAAQGVLDTIPAGPIPALHRGRQPRVVARRLVGGLAATAALTWVGLTTGVGVAAANGAGVAHPAPGAGSVVYVGIRVDGAELADPAVTAALEAVGGSVVVDDQTALADRPQLQDLVDHHVDIANGGRGHTYDAKGHLVRPTLWTRARYDVDAGTLLAAQVGKPVSVFVPGRRVNAFDLMDSSKAHDRVVVPNAAVRLRDSDLSTDPSSLTSHAIILIDGMGGSPAVLTDYLGTLRERLAAAGLSVVPFAALR